MEKNSVYIGAIGTANPPCKIAQKEVARLVQLHYGGILKPRSMGILSQALRHPSIESRHFALDSPEDIVVLKDEDPDKRNERFTRWSVELAVSAAKKTMTSACIAAEEISVLVVNTCTGYICPGIATYCLKPLDLRPDTLAFDLVGSGCGGALANLMMGEALLRGSKGGAALCISVEICTATYQMSDDPSLLISNAIFGDGAAAAILWKRPQGLRLNASASRFFPENRDDVRYVYKNGQLHNRITARLPAIVCRRVPEFIRAFLDEHGLSPENIDCWALHPGGDKMIIGLERELMLGEAHMAPIRSVFREFGNMSSPTVLFILERIMRSCETKQGWYLASAYGAGLSMHACLLQRTE